MVKRKGKTRGCGLHGYNFVSFGQSIKTFFSLDDWYIYIYIYIYIYMILNGIYGIGLPNRLSSTCVPPFLKNNNNNIPNRILLFWLVFSYSHNLCAIGSFIKKV